MIAADPDAGFAACREAAAEAGSAANASAKTTASRRVMDRMEGSLRGGLAAGKGRFLSRRSWVVSVFGFVLFARFGG